MNDTIDTDAYRELFAAEARELLNVLDDGLTRLAAGVEEPGDTDALFRAAHSLKGMAATLGHGDEARLAHHLEDHLSRMQAGKPVPYDTMLEAVAALCEAVEGIAAKSRKISLEGIIRRLEDASRSYPADRSHDAPASHLETNQPHDEGSQASAHGDTETTGQPTPAPASTRTRYVPPSVRVDAARLDAILDRTAALRAAQGRLERLLEEVLPERPGYSLSEVLGNLDRETHALYAQTLQLRTLPASLVTRPLVRRARQTANRHEKRVRLRLQGDELQLDRSLLDALGDPLMHLLTNAVVHGIETPDGRRQAGKAAEGTIDVSLERENGMLRVRVSDDGAGIDLDAVRERAVAQGDVTRDQAEAMTNEELVDLIARAGFTTTTHLTQEAGRGVGMDAVHDAVHRVGGRVHVATQAGRGTTVTLYLPPTLSLLEVVPVTINGQAYAVAAAQVERIVHLNEEGRRQERVGAGADEAAGRSGPVPVIPLAGLLGLNDTPGAYPVGEGEHAPIVHQARKIKQAVHRNTDAKPATAMAGPTRANHRQSDPHSRYRFLHRRAAARASRTEGGVGLRVCLDGQDVILAVDHCEPPEDAIVKPLHLPAGTPPGASGAIVMRDGRVAVVLDLSRLRPSAPPRSGL